MHLTYLKADHRSIPDRPTWDDVTAMAVATAPSPCHLEPDEGIELTAEMIEGGFQVLRASAMSDDLLEADRQTVADIYRAMARLAPARLRAALSWQKT